MSFAKYVNMDEDLSMIQYCCVAVGGFAICAYRALLMLTGDKQIARGIQMTLLVTVVVVSLSDFAQPPEKKKGPEPESDETKDGNQEPAAEKSKPAVKKGSKKKN